jgi:hypothetical protein
MLNKMVVQEALKRSRKLDYNPEWTPDYPADGEDSIISLLIHNIFGGEILKTHKKKSWHFYNRIDGERIDFAGSKRSKSSADNRFEDIPSTPKETFKYFEQEDYLTFFIRFIRAFEEIIDLEKYRPGIIV